MVIDHLRKIFKGRSLGESLEDLRDRAAGLVLRSPPLSLGNVLWFGQNSLPFRNSNAIQNLVHGFLDTGVRFVKPARRLGSQLTQHVTVPQSIKRVKNAIRAHYRSPSLGISAAQPTLKLRFTELDQEIRTLD
jgi:hypothetical protein